MSPPRQQWFIEKGHVDRHYWRDLWLYRELFWFLAWRDILVRYKQTVAGVGWALIRPAVTTLVFTVLFGRLGKLPSGGVPYPVLVLAAMAAWQMFSTALGTATQSLVSNVSLVSKVYFPRMIIPCGSVGATLADFFITLFMCVGCMLFYGIRPAVSWLAILPLSVLTLLVCLGPTLLISALTVQYRDFKHLVPFMVQIGGYVTPVGFSSAIVPEKWRLLFACNPMVGVIDGFRWALYGAPLDLGVFGVSCASAAVFMIVGVSYFRRTERGFADVI